MAKKTASTKKASKKVEVDASAVRQKSAFITIGMGASAGGLEAMVDLLHHLPETPNAAFVIIHHADPTHPSSMRHILSRESKIKIEDVEDGTVIEPNTVYIAPGGSDVTLENGALRMNPPA